MRLRELRAVLVLVPPLLSDLVRQVVVARAGKLGLTLSLLAEIDAVEDLDQTLRQLRPDVAILGPTESITHSLELSSRMRVLSLSPDLKQINGPGPDDSSPLTPDVFAQRLYEIACALESARP